MNGQMMKKISRTFKNNAGTDNAFRITKKEI